MLNFLSKLKFILRKPKVIIVTGVGKACTEEAISRVLSRHFRMGKKILIFQTDLAKKADLKKFKFLIRKSSLPILIVTNVGDIPPDKDFFAGEKEKTKKIEELVENLPVFGFLVLNFDDETARELKSKTVSHCLTFGLQGEADFSASDIVLTQFPSPGTNFKVNYRGNIVPVWLKNLFGKEQIYVALATAAVGSLLDLNLVEVSEGLKDYSGLDGKMRLVKGIKNSMILDDSESATPFSMAEALEILGKLSDFKRKIAVLGDIIGVGKYTIESHEAMGERAARVADVLFTFGPRAKFIVKGAAEKGMAIEKIFQFDTIDQGKLKLQNEIREGDLILVDGSREMKMSEIVKEIKFIK